MSLSWKKITKPQKTRQNSCGGTTDSTICPLRRFKKLTKLNLLPKRLARTRTSKCACYFCWSMTKQGWRRRAKLLGLWKATKPGQVVLVDMLDSSTLWLVAQLKRRLTVQGYKYTSDFKYHYSCYWYV